jgi:hypothetical protein
MKTHKTPARNETASNFLFRPIKGGERLKEGDQYDGDNGWQDIPPQTFGCVVAHAAMPAIYRRPLEADTARNETADQSQHTPGPWFVAGREIHDRSTEYSETGARIGNTPNSIAEIHPVPRGDAEANARLIAAAPELLAALEWCEKNLADIALPLADKYGHCTSMKSALDRARAAIASAKGVQS